MYAISRAVYQSGNERHASFHEVGVYLDCNDRMFSPEPCAVVWGLGFGHCLNTILGSQVRSNAGSPTSVWRLAEYKTLLSLVGPGKCVWRGYRCSDVFNRHGSGGLCNAPCL